MLFVAHTTGVQGSAQAAVDPHGVLFGLPLIALLTYHPRELPAGLHRCNQAATGSRCGQHHRDAHLMDGERTRQRLDGKCSLWNRSLQVRMNWQTWTAASPPAVMSSGDSITSLLLYHGHETVAACTETRICLPTLEIRIVNPANAATATSTWR